MNDVSVAERAVCQVKCSAVSPCSSRPTVFIVSSRPPLRCCRGTPDTTPTSPRPSWRPAVSPAPAAPQNARLTLTCMSTAASAPKFAAVASRPAPTCWAVLADRGGACDTAGAGSAWLIVRRDSSDNEPARLRQMPLAARECEETSRQSGFNPGSRAGTLDSPLDLDRGANRP
jgi:hypothetical protein